MIAAGCFALYFAAGAMYNYFATNLKGVHTKGTIIGYQRINNTGKPQPTFEFVTNTGQKIITKYKTSLPKSWNNSSYRYFKVNETIEVAYLQNEPQRAVIINWTSWIFYVLYSAVGLLFILIGFQFIFKKQTS